MKYLTKPSGKEIKIIHSKTEPVYLPWDLQTVLDLQLSFDDIQTLESDVVIGVGEIIMLLIDEGVR